MPVFKVGKHFSLIIALLCHHFFTHMYSPSFTHMYSPSNEQKLLIKWNSNASRFTYTYKCYESGTLPDQTSENTRF